jgi:uncharacterized membrane-anchored protein
MFRAIVMAVVVALSASAAARAAVEPGALEKQRAAFEASLTKRTGVITLDRPKAVLNLGQAYYWLDNADAKRVLVDAWGNPPQAAEDVYGMIFPAGRKVLEEGAWGAVVTYEGDGYVSDKEARKTDYAKILKQMKDGEDDQNRERTKAGYDTVTLVGWAQPPVYDPGRHSLIWARDLKFGGESGDTVNYDVRVLGRHGVLSMNIVGSMDQLAEIRPAGEALQGVASFTAGARYADYKPGVDKKAAYGLGGLILAGAGVAAVKKVGILAVLLVFLKKGAVVVIGLGAALVGWLKRRFGGRSKTLELGSTPAEDRKDDGPAGPWT